jgi:hydrogenase maturation protein HypF
VQLLRDRKFRKERPFALMARNLETARTLVDLPRSCEDLLMSAARPIVVAPARAPLDGVAPDNRDLGVMLPYAPVHYLLFAAGAPDALVMTSANRSSEPIAYRDEEALTSLDGVADAFLMGERPIRRRIEDSIVRPSPFGPTILRRSRGYAPGVVARLPSARPILGLGADLKNSIALAIDGEVIVSQHIGDLENCASREAFFETIRDLIAMYGVHARDLLIAHDLHPQYSSTQHAAALPCHSRVAIQHHRAHIASVIAEREAWDTRVLGVAFDGTGYGDDGAIWGGEIFAGSVRDGFVRVAHVRPATLPGGDAAAQHPVQAAAGFLDQLDDLPDLSSAPFDFPDRYRSAVQLLRTGIRSFTTSSMGRLFDCAAALCGFTRPVTFEGQAAMWLEHLAWECPDSGPYSFPFPDGLLDFRPLLQAILRDRLHGVPPAQIARSFHAGIAQGLVRALVTLASIHRVSVVALSGGVFQNSLLLDYLAEMLAAHTLTVWTNRAVPPNDGGVSLGQAALAFFEEPAHA